MLFFVDLVLPFMILVYSQKTVPEGLNGISDLPGNAILLYSSYKEYQCDEIIILKRVIHSSIDFPV